MRTYALLLGALVTAGSAYVAEVAVASSGLERAWTVLHAKVDPPLPIPLWYGGILDPITIEARRPTAAALVMTGFERARSDSQCPAAQTKYRPISSANVRTSIGLVM